MLGHVQTFIQTLAERLLGSQPALGFFRYHALTFFEKMITMSTKLYKNLPHPDSCDIPVLSVDRTHSDTCSSIFFIKVLDQKFTLTHCFTIASGPGNLLIRCSADNQFCRI